MERNTLIRNNTLLKTTLVSLAILGSLLTGTVNADEALDQVNAEVEQTAAQINADHGILLTTAERENLKLSIIVKKVTTIDEDVQLDVVEATDQAIETYEITDPTSQRKLLIETNGLSDAGVNYYE